jgi:hypothetical protein
MNRFVGQSRSMGQINFCALVRDAQSTVSKRNLVGRAGFEPATNWLKASCPNSPQPNNGAVSNVFTVPQIVIMHAVKAARCLVSIILWDRF